MAYQQLIANVDFDLVEKIANKIKSQGIFDQFRKDCLSDVDTKPAYQNLQQRVNGCVTEFLAARKWSPDLNKTQLRESLRRHLQQTLLDIGVDRIVDQVVNPKIFSVFTPKVEDMVYETLGIEKPKRPERNKPILASSNRSALLSNPASILARLKQPPPPPPPPPPPVPSPKSSPKSSPKPTEVKKEEPSDLDSDDSHTIDEALLLESSPKASDSTSNIRNDVSPAFEPLVTTSNHSITVTEKDKTENPVYNNFSNLSEKIKQFETKTKKIDTDIDIKIENENELKTPIGSPLSYFSPNKTESCVNETTQDSIKIKTEDEKTFDSGDIVTIPELTPIKVESFIKSEKEDSKDKTEAPKSNKDDEKKSRTDSKSRHSSHRDKDRSSSHRDKDRRSSHRDKERSSSSKDRKERTKSESDKKSDDRHRSSSHRSSHSHRSDRKRDDDKKDDDKKKKDEKKRDESDKRKTDDKKKDDRKGDDNDKKDRSHSSSSRRESDKKRDDKKSDDKSSDKRREKSRDDRKKSDKKDDKKEKDSRKRKSEKCGSETKEQRRSSDRDNSGSGGSKSKTVSNSKSKSSKSKSSNEENVKNEVSENKTDEVDMMLEQMSKSIEDTEKKDEPEVKKIKVDHKLETVEVAYESDNSDVQEEFLSRGFDKEEYDLALEMQYGRKPTSKDYLAKYSASVIGIELPDQVPKDKKIINSNVEEFKSEDDLIRYYGFLGSSETKPNDEKPFETNEKEEKHVIGNDKDVAKRKVKTRRPSTGVSKAPEIVPAKKQRMVTRSSSGVVPIKKKFDIEIDDVDTRKKKTSAPQVRKKRRPTGDESSADNSTEMKSKKLKTK